MENISFCLCLFTLVLIIPCSLAFLPTSLHHITPRKHLSTAQNVQWHSLYLSRTNDDSMDERERMRLVRELQKTFYKSSSVDESTNENSNEEQASSSLTNASLDKTTGIVHNLPLWRVGWVEVPGRTNCLNVHEGQYTHMFETIVNGPKPWYVGHLYLPGGFKMTRTGESRFKLKNWQEEIQDKQRYQERQRSAVVGCLMQITDCRRMQDGRMTLLVQTLERFVVDSVVQEFPYSVADVQILPDQDEYTDLTDDENFAKISRGNLVSNSFEYHPYEFAPCELPISRNIDYLDSGAVNKEAISRLLPFAMYSQDESLLEGIEMIETSILPEGSGFAGASKPLEHHLQKWRILKDPSQVNVEDGVSETRELRNTDAKGLETLIWLALEDLVRKTGFVLPKEILILQPPEMDYLDLHPGGGTESAGTIDFVHLEDSVQSLSDKYPIHRRQKRLSYALPALLESSPSLESDHRQALLSIPTTQRRLQLVLERLEALNTSLVGSFE